MYILKCVTIAAESNIEIFLVSAWMTKMPATICYYIFPFDERSYFYLIDIVKLTARRQSCIIITAISVAVAADID